jgi:tetrahydromethanopterin S-methyltransferase subunit D
MAFTQNTTPTMVKQPQNGKVQILPADASNQKTVVTAGASGTKVTSLCAVSNDTAARDVQVSITNAGTSFPLGTVTVPAGAGFSGSVVAIDLMNQQNLPGLAIDSDGNPYINLISGDTLTVSSLTTVTAAKAITVTAPGVGDF